MFISFEGVDGSGKTTQVALLADLAPRGRPRGRRHPGARRDARRRADPRALLEGGEIAPWTEAALFAAARAQLVDEVIRPALARGADVICDRYIDSSLAYQGIGSRPRCRARARAEPARHLGPSPRPDLLPRDLAAKRRPGERTRSRTGSSERATSSPPSSIRATESWRRSSPSAWSPSMRPCPRATSRGRYVDSFETLPEQEDAKRLLRAALG